MCTKRIVTHGFLGKTSHRCEKPDFRDGLCEYHYNRSVLKSQKWGDRNNYYRSIREDEFRMGKTMKLKESNEHVIYRQRNGAIQRYYPKSNIWLDTDLKLNHTHFCVKRHDI